MTEAVVEVRDERGEGFDLLQYDDVIMTKKFFDNQVGISLKEQTSHVQNIRYREGDVLICSYPKTGTHWINNLVSMLLNTDKDTIEDACSVSPLILNEFPKEMWLSRPSPRVLTTHTHVGRISPDLKEKAKLVYIIRNPKDACVSLYHFLRKSIVKNKQSWESLLEYYLHGPLSYGIYTDFLKDLQKEMSENPDFRPCIVFFENLKTDGVSELRKLQKYLGMQHPDSRLQAILNRCDVRRLRSDVTEGKSKSVFVDQGGVIYRKGEVGDWKNHFTVTQSERFDQVWSDIMADSMFKFEYE